MFEHFIKFLVPRRKSSQRVNGFILKALLTETILESVTTQFQ